MAAKPDKALKPLYKMSYLILDDFPSARKSVRSMLTQLGVENIREAGTAAQAKKLLKNHHFDIVVCDFNLGQGQDGQQLLEEMRGTAAISHLTQWVIITAETSKDMVMGAMECQPDDYLAKPFAFDTFKLRLDKWVKRLHALQPLLSAMDGDDQSVIIAAAEQAIAEHPRYRVWARKVKINALIHSGDLDAAEAELNGILERRQQDWALYEKARVQMLRHKFRNAIILLEEVLNTNPNNVAAFDRLAACYLELKKPEKAQAALLKAIRLSPRNLRRQRQLAEISRRQRDYNIATKAYREVLSLASNTRHDTPINYINLATTLNTAARHGLDLDLRNASRQALQVSQRMMHRFPENVPLQIKSRMMQVDSLDIQGLTNPRDSEINKVYDLAMRNVDAIKPDFGIEIAEHFYHYEKKEQGDQWVNTLRSHHQDDPPLQEKLMLLQSEPVSERDRKRAAEANHQGNESYRAGHFRDSLRHFKRALEYSPRHPGLLLNIVQSYLKLYQQEQEPEHLYNMNKFLDRLNYLPEDHYQFERYRMLRKRYQILAEGD